MDQQAVEQYIQQALASQEQRYGQTIEALKAEISNLKSSIIENFLNRPMPTPKPKLPDIAKFDGTSTMWAVWHPEIKAKLRIDGEAFGDEKEGGKFWYLYGRLDTKVQELVAPQLAQAEETQSFDHQVLLNQLSRLGDDPNARRNAEEKLQSSKMYSDETVNAFLARFERKLYKAQANKWSDAAKISLLRRQLNSHTKTLLRTQVNEPEDYDGFIKLLQRLDNKHYISPAVQHSGQSQRPSKTGDPMDLSAVAGVGALTYHNEDDEEDVEEDTEEESNIRLLYNHKTGKFQKVRI